MPNPRLYLPAILAGAAVLLTVPVVLGFWGALHPAFDSLAHFRIHLSVLIVLLSLPCLFLRGWRRIGAAAAVLGLAAIGSATLPQMRGQAEANALPAADEAAPARYRLLHLNLRFDNTTPKAVLSLIGRSGADVVTLNEISRMWLGELESIEAAYPHRVVCRVPANLGVAILSRRPFVHSAAARCANHGALAMATVDFGGRPVDIATLHLGWPWPYRQPHQIGRVAPALARLGPTAILAGDFNATPWSVAARRIAQAGGLTALADIGPTWLLHSLPDALRRTVGLPIDNVLVKGDVVPLATRRAADVGSDHLPVLLEFALRGRARPAEVLQAALERQSGMR